jgi:hypothetical protein
MGQVAGPPEITNAQAAASDDRRELPRRDSCRIQRAGPRKHHGGRAGPVNLVVVLRVQQDLVCVKRKAFLTFCRYWNSAFRIGERIYLQIEEAAIVHRFSEPRNVTQDLLLP